MGEADRDAAAELISRSLPRLRQGRTRIVRRLEFETLRMQRRGDLSDDAVDHGLLARGQHGDGGARPE